MLLDDLRLHLLNGSIGSTAVYCGWMPVEPATAVSLYETGGLPSVHAMSSGPGAALVEQPRFQLVVRDPDYEVARSIIEKAHHWLDGVRDIDINSTRYHWIEAVQQPFFLEKDENDRYKLAANYQVIRNLQATATSTSDSYDWIGGGWA